MTLSGAIHLLLHVAVPIAVAVASVRKEWLRPTVIMLATMLVDVDHLLATPIYDPNRCSIGFHPLHSAWAIAMYLLLLVPKPTRWVGVGLCIHMALDAADCGAMRWL